MNDTSTATGIDPNSPYAQENNLANILVPSIVFHSIAIVFVGMRCYCRHYIKHGFGKDDILMVVGTVFTLGGIITFIGMAFHGLGRHWSTIPLDERVRYVMWNFAHTMLAQATGLTLVKTSIAVSLLRMSDRRFFHWVIWPMIVLLAAMCICGYFSFFLRCIPLRGWFDRRIPAYCYPVSIFTRLGIFNTCFNVATDIICATLPIPMIWRLQMRLGTRLYLTAIFSLGWVAVAMGIAKGVYQIAYAKEADSSFKLGIQFWGFLQINFGIIAACAPSIKPLIGGFLHLSNGASGADQPSRSNALRTFGGGPMARDGGSASRGGTKSPYGRNNTQDGLSLGEIELSVKNIEHGPGYHASIHGGRSPVDSAEEILARERKRDRADDDRVSGTGSEEMILCSQRQGIVKTTEVNVRDG